MGSYLKEELKEKVASVIDRSNGLNSLRLYREIFAYFSVLSRNTGR